MFQNVETLIVAIATSTIMLVVLLFLPAIIELKKPRDAGPRLITDSHAQNESNSPKIALPNVEGELEFNGQSAISPIDFPLFISTFED
jgi:hypothetical protein